MKREVEEQLFGVMHPRGCELPELIVVAVGVSQRAGEYGRVGSGTCDSQLGEQGGKLAAVQQVTRQRVQPN
jgi:hypothetical protein